MSRDTQAPEDPQLSALYQATRQAQPSAELDAAIRAEAQRALRGRRRSWMVPLSTAALVVIGLSLSLQVLELDRPPESPAKIDFAPIEEAEEAPAPALEMAEPAPAGAAPESAALPPSPTAADSAPALQKPPPPAKAKRLQADEEMGLMRERKQVPIDQDSRLRKAPASKDATKKAETAFDDLGVDGFESGLDEIRALLAQGDMEKARAILQDLVRQYPERALPEDLRSLLGKP